MNRCTLTDKRILWRVPKTTWMLSELDVALVIEMGIHVVRNVDIL